MKPQTPIRTVTAVAVLAGAVAGLLGGIAVAEEAAPGPTPGRAVFCDDPRYLPRTPDSAEQWLETCR